MSQNREVIYFAVTGYKKLLAKVDKGERPLHQPREWEVEARKRKKILAKAAWFRPADTGTFIPAIPGGKQTEQRRDVLEEEGKRLQLTIKAVETGGSASSGS